MGGFFGYLGNQLSNAAEKFGINKAYNDAKNMVVNSINDYYCCYGIKLNTTYNFEHRITDKDIQSISIAYMTNVANILEINLSYNKLTDKGASVLSKLLELIGEGYEIIDVTINFSFASC